MLSCRQPRCRGTVERWRKQIIGLELTCKAHVYAMQLPCKLFRLLLKVAVWWFAPKVLGMQTVWCLAPSPEQVLVRFRRPPLFFFLSLSGFARCGLKGWCWCFLLLLFFFCVPRLVFRLSNFSSHLHFHLIFVLFSSSFSSHCPGLNEMR